MRDAFAVLFFVSVGMLFDPRYLLEAPGLLVADAGRRPRRQAAGRAADRPAAAATRSASPSRSPSRWPRSASSRSSWRRSAATSASCRPAATNALVAAAIVSILLNPLLYRLIGPHRAWASRATAAVADAESAAAAAASRGAGGGAASGSPQPRRRHRLRSQRADGDPPAPRERRRADGHRAQHRHGPRDREKGVPAVYGDATQRETLVGAGVPDAAHLILTSPGMRGSAEILRIAQELNPAIHVLARASYLRDIPELKKAGADMVFTGEGEVALALTEATLQRSARRRSSWIAPATVRIGAVRRVVGPARRRIRSGERAWRTFVRRSMVCGGAEQRRPGGLNSVMSCREDGPPLPPRRGCQDGSAGGRPRRAPRRNRIAPLLLAAGVPTASLRPAAVSGSARKTPVSRASADRAGL